MQLILINTNQNDYKNEQSEKVGTVNNYLDLVTKNKKLFYPSSNFCSISVT